MKRMLALLITAMSVGVFAPHSASATAHKNVVIIITDDQRWDKVTPTYTPEISAAFAGHFFDQGIVPNSLCCPSRTSILSGDYSHTTGVWDNEGQYGGFDAFGGSVNPTADDHTLAVDFNQAGYRTAMIGKYLNHYITSKQTYVPPGWDRWFAIGTGAYYDYKAVARHRPGGKTHDLYFGHHPEADYSTNVVRNRALDFISDAGQNPFLLYLSWAAPHGPAIPDPDDRGRFAGDTDYTYPSAYHSSSLESAYSADRATGRILDALPSNTIVVFLSDNGYLWGEHGLTGKMQPYEEATRVPFAMMSLDGSWSPSAGLDDVVANVDIRPTVTEAAGIGAPLVPVDGIDLGATDYTPRDAVVLEHRNDAYSYCGVRTANWMYARFNDGRELMFDLKTDYAEETNLVDTDLAKTASLRDRAKTLCSPTPPGYTWGP